MKVISANKWSCQRAIPAARVKATQAPRVRARMTVLLRLFNRLYGHGGLSFAVRLG